MSDQQASLQQEGPKEYKFTKMHGLGNDFIILDQRDGGESLEAKKIAVVACRHKGVGCDQVIHIKPPQSENADIYLDMYNSDGHSVDACGNATRCVASMLMKETDVERVNIETGAGILECTAASINKAEVTVNMGKPRLDWDSIPLSMNLDPMNLDLGDADLPKAVAVNMGNPHVVFFVDDINAINVEAKGPTVEFHKLFPERTNVEFVQRLNENTLRMRVWERGAGLTQACGSGACAVVVAAVLKGIANRKSEVILDGGSLFIEWRESDDNVLMTGPATHVFTGTVSV